MKSQLVQARGHDYQYGGAKCTHCGLGYWEVIFEMSKGNPAVCLGQRKLDEEIKKPQQALRRKRVYIAGPYSQGEPEANVASAIDAANALLDRNYAPFVPHLTHFWHLQHNRPYEEWMGLDFEWVQACDCLLRLEGPSSGADREVVLATNKGIPVYLSLDTLVACEPPLITLKT